MPVAQIRVVTLCRVRFGGLEGDGVGFPGEFVRLKLDSPWRCSMGFYWSVLCDYEVWWHAREVFTVLCLAYLVLRSR